MRMYDIIKKKRDGGELSREEIRFFIENYTKGEIPDYQASALLMAVCLRRMSFAETFDLTEAIAESGDTVDLSRIQGIKVDKHSTGGVGDKTSIIVAPVVAACGGRVAKMSGRGLGHTGGTVDKLESVTGYRTSLPREKFIEIVNNVGCSIIGQSGELAPADKKLYALRDVTATVENPSLIAASIMSKKLASGADKILLDVKVGNGSFNKTPSDGEELARLMVELGKKHGKETVAVISNMDIPLGKTIGNALEVAECVDVLRCKGDGDLTELSVELAANMLYLSEKGSVDECRRMAKDAITSGKALNKLAEMVEAHGGDKKLIYCPELFAKAPLTEPIKAPVSGYIGALNTAEYGKASLILGAGRNKKDDVIDFSAGIVLNKKYGEYVELGETFATLHTSNGNSLREAAHILLSATEFTDVKPEKQQLILGRIV